MRASGHSLLKQCLLSISAILLLASCEPMVDTRGHNIEAADFKQIIIGQSKSDDVVAILGSPSARSTFGEEVWYYITERKETFGMLPPEVADHTVTSIRFAENGTVATIEEQGKKDGVPVELVEKTTATEGHHMTIIEQLIGNVGRFSSPGRQVNPQNMNRF